MAKKYRKKQETVEAIQCIIFETSNEELVEFIGDDMERVKGWVIRNGDYIIRNSDGVIGLTSQSAFEATYEAMTSNIGNLAVNVKLENLGTDVNKVIAGIMKMKNELANNAL